MCTRKIDIFVQSKRRQNNDIASCPPNLTRRDLLLVGVFGACPVTNTGKPLWYAYIKMQINLIIRFNRMFSGYSKKTADNDIIWPRDCDGFLLQNNGLFLICIRVRNRIEWVSDSKNRTERNSFGIPEGSTNI